MRLTEGFFRIWLEDMDHLFSQSPKDFAMFCYLLANCHYKERAFEVQIKGNTQKKEAYNKKWLIQKGDYFGSKHKIRDFWKFDVRTQKTIFESLAEKGIIEILLEDPALILRIKNYEHFAWRGKSDERPPLPLSSGECNPTLGECNPTLGGVENYIGGGVILHEADKKSVKKNIEVEENYTQSLLHSSSTSLSSSIGGGGRARAEFQPRQSAYDLPILWKPAEQSTPPLFKNLKLISQEEGEIQAELDAIWDKVYGDDAAYGYELTPEEEKRVGELTEKIKALSDPRKSSKNPQPEPENDLSIRWHTYGVGRAKNDHSGIERYSRAIDEILSRTKYSRDVLTQILRHIESGRDSMLTSRFIFPWQWKREWELGGLSFLDEAHNSMRKKKSSFEMNQN